MALLECTREFNPDCSQWHWWLYVTAALLCYNLIPRALLLFYARNRFYRGLKIGESPPPPPTQPSPPPPSPGLAAVVYSAPRPYMLVNWHPGAPEFTQQYVAEKWGAPRVTIERSSDWDGRFALIKKDGVSVAVENLAAAEVCDAAKAGAKTVVILVKSWEPPMGELKDFTRQLRGFSARLLLPLDWGREKMNAVKPTNLDEWRRFGAEAAGGWKALQAKEGA